MYAGGVTGRCPHGLRCKYAHLFSQRCAYGSHGDSVE
ncbi:MAG: hypothetical protein DMF71_06595 [Acidobacteria bacterium]|nr:MAG: hypothetical protein DMF71_06595 [Acidobacteriota bacterium]